MISPKNLFYLLLLTLSLGLSSCMSITEEYFFRKDGSGNATYLIDMSEMMRFVNMFQEEAGDEGGKEEGMGKLKEIFDSSDHIEILGEIAGISNVTNLNDPDKFLIGFSFEFDNLDALNEAMSTNSLSEMVTAMNGEGGGSADKPQGMFSLKGKKFMRQHPMDNLKSDEMEENQENLEMASMFFQDADYTIRYSFDREIKKAKNPNGYIGGDRKTLTLRQNLVEIMQGKGDLSVKMKLRNK